MEYHEAANALFDLRRYAPRPGIGATADLLAHLGDPHDGVACVQVAGSNGKGSTSRMLESVLREAGYSVGLYTSPHLEDVRDRVQVDGRRMTEDALTTYVEAIDDYVTKRAAAGEAPTFFETLTAMALWEFGRQDVDVAVLEVGIGGKRDATSVVDPVASAVTTVTLEHTDTLGETVDAIARDKAHVAPADAPLVTATTGEALAAVREVAGDVVTVDAPQEESAPDVTVSYEGRDGLEGVATIAGEGWSVDARLPLLGAHQARNAAVAATLARQIVARVDGGTTIDAATTAAGLRGAAWPGRFEVMGREPLVVLEGAHNPGGCERVAKTLASFEYDDLHLVVGAMHDKDHRGIAAAFDDATTVVACEPTVPRREADEVIAAAFRAETDAEVSTRSDVAGALERALDQADPDDAVLVTGSLYAVREARRRWSRPMTTKRIEDVPDASRTLAAANVTDAGTWRMRGKAVHRVVRTRVQPRQAQYLKEELLSLGGECAISGLGDQHEESLSVVLMGTLAQFRRLVDKLHGQPYGLAPLGQQVREHLGIGVEVPTPAGPWADGTAIMGILNVTPDSFHDGGRYDSTEAAIERAEAMVAAGADIVDVGGESTRPGAEPVPVDEERDRVVPVVEGLADLDATVSVDTRKPVVARAALEAGADLLNDVTGLEDPAMREVAAAHDVPVVVMHSLDAPVDPDHEVDYDDVVADVLADLSERVLLAERAGLDRSQLLVDPGLGFGKSAEESFALLERLDEFQALGCPVMVGHSHKSMFAAIDRGPEERGDATVAGTALAVERGADVVRVHDVAANRAAVDTIEAAAAARRGDDR